MIELVQFPWSPFCLVQRRILEYAGVPFKVINLRINDRSKVWHWTRQRYYEVPILKDGKAVVFETDSASQVIAKYLDSRLQLGLFPHEWEGHQGIIWGYIEDQIEGLGFKLNDIHWREFVPKADAWGFVRHKERRFGRGCLDQWAHQQAELLAALEQKLVPFEQMLAARPFLLDERPRFVDFDLYGMLANFLFTGHYELPRAHNQLQAWYARLGKIKSDFRLREKLHS